MTSNRFFSWIGLGVAAVLLVGINVVAMNSLRGARADLTDRKLYTLSDGTRNVLRGIREPIRLDLYFSRSLASEAPAVLTLGNRVQELLEEYRDLSGGMVRLNLIDPEGFSEEEDDAVAAGLQGVPINRAGDVMFLGLVGTNSVDERESIPMFTFEREAQLEYDLTSLVHNLANPGKRTIGLMTELPVLGEDSPFNVLRRPEEIPQKWLVMTQVEQMFDLRMVQPDATSIPSDIDLLLLIHPKTPSDETLYAIDQFVLGGGRLLAFIDPLSEDDEPPFDPENPYTRLFADRSSTLGPLLENWGIEYDNRRFVADRATARMVAPRGPRGVSQPVEYVAYWSTRRDNINQDDMLTMNIEGLEFGTPGALIVREDAPVDIEVLIKSSADSMMIPTESVQINPDPWKMLDEFEPAGEEFPLAVRISGRPRSAFNADGTRRADLEDEGAGEPREPNPNHIEEAPDEIVAVIVSDVDMMLDRFWSQTMNMMGQRVAVPRAQNGAFVLNALEYLSGSTDLLRLRSRGVVARPFTRIQELERVAQERYRERESQLSERLSETEERISTLQFARTETGQLTLSPEQQSELEKLNEEMIATRRDLRTVQRDLRRDEEALRRRIIMLNTLLVPGLLSVLALGLWGAQIAARRRRAA